MALYSFTSHTFTNCGQTQETGPTLAQCKSEYTRVGQMILIISMLLMQGLKFGLFQSQQYIVLRLPVDQEDRVHILMLVWLEKGQ